MLRYLDTIQVISKILYFKYVLELKILSEFLTFFLVTVLPHTLNKGITVYDIEKSEDDPIEFLVNLVNDFFC